MAEDDEDDETPATPARELVMLVDRIADDVGQAVRLLSAGVPASDAERRRMRALLVRLERDSDELLDIACSVAHVETKIQAGTN